MANVPQNFLDLGKMMSSADPSKMVEEFSKMMGQFKLPGVDVDSLVASQKKNVEALVSANRTALEAMQAIMKRQAEILQETMAETSKAVTDMSKAGSTPQALVAAQADFAKAAFERGLANMREVAEMVTKSQAEATNIISARVSSQLQEIRDAAMNVKLGA